MSNFGCLSALRSCVHFNRKMRALGVGDTILRRLRHSSVESGSSGSEFKEDLW